MLETFYNTFGFVGAFLISFTLFIFAIFWLGGIAGISQKRGHATRRRIQLVVSILFPPYPLIWMIWDMIQQKIHISREE
ncbi:MAG: hypothetical protein WD115_01080 [Balneolaceae bacterium]